MLKLAGATPHKLDPNGRIKLREEELAELGSVVVVSCGFDNCVSVFTPPAWERFVNDFERLGRQDPAAHDLRRLLIGTAERLEIDAQGRAKLPPFLQQWAGLGEGRLGAILTKVGEGRWECWEAERYAEFLNARQESLKDIAGSYFRTGPEPDEEVAPTA